MYRPVAPHSHRPTPTLPTTSRTSARTHARYDPVPTEINDAPEDDDNDDEATMMRTARHSALPSHGAATGDGASIQLASLLDDHDEFDSTESDTPPDSHSDLHTCFSRVRGYFRKSASFRERRVFFNPAATSGVTPISVSGAFGERDASFPHNVVSNTKYNVVTFLPLFLYEQFSFFFNFYFLLVALSQFIPALQIGYLFTYVAPLAFVLAITMAKEAYDDFQRWRRDREANSQRYTRLRRIGSGGSDEDVVEEEVPSSDISVGDLLLLHTNQRVPADLLLLRTHDRTNGSVFIRTDQLDGETDWKLRNSVRATQSLQTDAQVAHIRATVQIEAPRKAIYEFAANFIVDEPNVAVSSSAPAPTSTSEPLNLDNTLWANTVLASGTVVGLVVYTGTETRAVMNANQPVTKIGLLDMELNRLSKLLFVLTVLLAFVMTALKGLHGSWLLYLFRFILLFSSIIPISMRVNLDMSKTLCSWLIMHDSSIPDTVMRNSTIPEELGRVSYVFSDKTGTLTRNVMTFKCLQMEPPVFFTKATLGRLRSILEASFKKEIAGTKDHATEVHTTNGAIGMSIDSSNASSLASSLAGASHFDRPLSPDVYAAAPSSAPVKRKISSASSVAASPTSFDDGSIGATSKLRMSRQSSLDSLRLSAVSLDDEEDLSDAPSEHGSFIDSGKALSDVAGGTKKRGGYVNLLREREETDREEDEIGQAREQQSAGNESLHRSSLAASPRTSSSSRPSTPDGDDEDDDPSAPGPYAAVPSEKVESMVRRLVTSLALCHNVTPAVEDGVVVYQASSPDEVALVKFTESVGLRLVERTQHRIDLQTPLGRKESYEVLHVFPFTSESRRMGIIVRALDGPSAGTITFYLKGAESIMKSKIVHADWLEEEVDNLARVGLRTLVIAAKPLSEGEYAEFLRRYTHARSVLQDRDAHVLAVMSSLEQHMDLLGLTGVEDKLQEHVKSTLETLRNAGIHMWMLTGDKAETAQCIGISARLIDRNQPIFQFLNCTTQREAARLLDHFSTKVNTCLVIDGPSLQICLDSFEQLFLELACVSPAVICCRCSPTQKATVVELMRTHTGKRTAAIGDGGNDVSMILAADVGIGIVGKEGKQASLAADVSITQFSHILPLLLWHGRNAYKRSARLSQFVMHRGLIISIMQAVFSALFFFAAVSLFDGWLMVGYSTFYTMLPVFSLVLDEDVDENKVYLYPELYKDLQKGRPLSFKTFFVWVFQSVYQGGIIMILSIVLFETRFLNIISITFTSLILSELLNVALEVHKWHKFMIIAEVGSIIVYFASLVLLQSYFDITFIFTLGFLWKVVVMTTVSCLPPALVKYLHSKYNPSAQSKVNQS